MQGLWPDDGSEACANVLRLLCSGDVVSEGNSEGSFLGLITI